MANQETLTAPLAVIMVGDKVIGRMRDIRYNETYRRIPVKGIGRLNPIEVPVVDFSASLTCSFYAINFAKHPLTRDAILRAVGDGQVENWQNTVTLQEIGLTVKCLRKKAGLKTPVNQDGRDGNGIIEANVNDYEIFATIKRAFITGDGFDISEGNVSAHNSTFDVTDPVVYAVERGI